MNYDDDDLFEDDDLIEDDLDSDLDDNVDLEEFEAARLQRLAEANEW